MRKTLAGRPWRSLKKSGPQVTTDAQQETHGWILKHSSSSSLRDTHITVQINRETKTVELTSGQFDSVHIGGFVLNALPKYGVNAALDESDFDNVRNPTWDLIYVMGGVKYKCLVAVIPDYSIKDGVPRGDPRREIGKQTTVTLTRIDGD